jgi:hypothetical protein
MSEDKFMERLTQRDSADGYAYWIAGGLVGLGLVLLGFSQGISWVALFVGTFLTTFAIMVMLDKFEFDGYDKAQPLGMIIACALNATAWVIIVASIKGIFA